MRISISDSHVLEWYVKSPTQAPLGTMLCLTFRRRPLPQCLSSGFLGDVGMILGPRAVSFDMSLILTRSEQCRMFHLRNSISAVETWSACRVVWRRRYVGFGET